jgi:protein-S-isoprenylcysteine O-methyltransferase Ste14
MTISAETNNRNNVAAQLSITAVHHSTGLSRLWAHLRAFLVRRRTFLGIAVAFALLAVAQPRPYHLILGVALMAAAHALRLLSSGYLNKDEQLVTSGPFAWCRNPLYLGNYLVTIAFVAMSGQWLALPLVLLLSIATQVPTVTYEEQFLREKFGAEFERYCKRVPRWLPRVPHRPDNPGSLHGGRLRPQDQRRFSWRRVLDNQEHLNIISAWLLAAMFFVELVK